MRVSTTLPTLALKTNHPSLVLDHHLGSPAKNSSVFSSPVASSVSKVESSLFSPFKALLSPQRAINSSLSSAGSPPQLSADALKLKSLTESVNRSLEQSSADEAMEAIKASSELDNLTSQWLKMATSSAKRSSKSSA